MKFFYCLVFFFVTFFSSSQKQIDSLKAVLEFTEPKSTTYIDLLNEIGYSYWIVDSNASLDYGNKALMLSDSLNYLEGKARASRVIGVAFWTRGNYTASFKALNSALKQYKTLNSLEEVANCTLNIGMLYAALHEEDKALEMYQDAIDQFTALDLKSRIATTFTKIATIYIDQDRLYEAKDYLTNALKMHDQANFTYGIGEVHNRLGQLYIKLNEKEQAYYHIEQSIMKSRAVHDTDGMINNLIQYGKLLLLDKKFDVSQQHLELAISRAKKNNLKRYELESYKILKDLKLKANKPEEALVYYDKYIALKDSVFNSEKTMRIATIEFENELDNKEKELALLQEKKKTDDIIKWGLIIGVLCFMFIATLYLMNLKKRISQRRELQTTKEEYNKAELENAKFKQQELKQKLDFRNKELTSYTLNFVQKSELFQDLKEKIELLKSATPKTQQSIINELSRIIKQHINIDRDWEDFKRYFEDVHTDFIKELKSRHPDLSANDMRICTLTRLNLNIKETASVLGITPESVKTARYRLRKKLNLDANQELLSYFLSLEN
ncbi:tetratricopeptide repeat protein [uncultured Psychroserpens sp.]|uniref:tetratricopeptide repeat protein n=1 Tax=uncultured Psychroserpens sp. TaxID=255436 RepID=UPI00260CB30F|nr:tetratricopeptide repeat protein [uncultured Psychroserpens sp.]